jgi:E3 ubiquitin ligase
VLVLGVILLVGGGLLLWGSASAARRMVAVSSAETQTAAALEKLRGEMASEVGAGALRDICAIEGKAESARPLSAEISGKPCVYCSVRVEREYEETRQDANGQTSTSRGSETVASNVQQVDFELRDATGAVLVQPADASVEARKVVERFDPAGSGFGALVIGNLRFEIAPPPGTRRTLGYKIVEHVLAVGDRLYVLGEARDRDGRVVIAKPTKAGAKFIISGRSKEELVRSAASQARWMRGIGLAVIVGGVVLAVVGLIKR